MNAPIVPYAGETALSVLGRMADAYARQGVFEDYRKRRAAATLRAQRADLAAFSAFLAAAGLPGIPSADELGENAEAWRGVSAGLIEAFKLHMERAGYAVATINRRLATVRRYAALAARAGVIAPDQHALICMVNGYSGKDGRKVDETRAASGVATRTGAKKAAHVSLTLAQARTLKRQPDTPQGRRDGLLMCLLLDHALRVGELVRLQVEDFDLAAGELRFYRPKVDKVQRHKLSADTLRAVHRWIDAGDCPGKGPILRNSRKGGALTHAGMHERAASERVRVLGKRVGVEGLSAHDCRHYALTNAAHHGTDTLVLQEFGGWSSLAMVRRYVEERTIANEHVQMMY